MIRAGLPLIRVRNYIRASMIGRLKTEGNMTRQNTLGHLFQEVPAADLSASYATGKLGESQDCRVRRSSDTAPA